MAEAPLVDPHRDFFEALRRVVDKLQVTDRSIFFAMAARLGEAGPDDWTFVVGSLKYSNQVLKGTQRITQVLSATLSNGMAARIVRVGSVSPTDPVYLAIRRFVAVDQEPDPSRSGRYVRVAEVSFDDIRIVEGAIFKCGKAPARANEARRAKAG